MIPGTSMKSTTNREDAVNERNTGAARQSRKCFRFDRTAWQFSRRKNDLFRQFGDVCLGCPVLASSVIRGSFIESESDALYPKALKEGYLRIYPRLDLISALTGESTFSIRAMAAMWDDLLIGIPVRVLPVEQIVQLQALGGLIRSRQFPEDIESDLPKSLKYVHDGDEKRESKVDFGCAHPRG